MSDRLSAVIVDGRRARSDQLAAMLGAAGLEVAGQACHGIAALSLAQDVRPRLAFVGLERPAARGLQTINALVTALPEATVVAYSDSVDTQMFQQVTRAGAAFLLEMPVEEAELARLISAASRRRARPAAAPQLGKVVAVVGQKGGIGKTAVSTNLAAALARETAAPVLIIDFDTSFGDVALAFNVHGETTAARTARGLPSMDREAFKEALVEHDSGVFVLPAPAHVDEWLHVLPEEMASLVEVGSSLFDYVILDTPGALTDTVEAAVGSADHLLVVTSLELTSVKNTSLLLAALGQQHYPAEQILVVANHTQPHMGQESVDLASALERDSIWDVPFDMAIRKGSQDGRPPVLSHPSAPASRSLRALARRLVDEPGCLDRRSRVRQPRPRARTLFRARLHVPFTLRRAS